MCGHGGVPVAAGSPGTGGSAMLRGTGQADSVPLIAVLCAHKGAKDEDWKDGKDAEFTKEEKRGGPWDL